MKFTFKLTRGTEHELYETMESNTYKPLFYYLKVFKEQWQYCKIYCDDLFLFDIRSYGNRTYVTRYHEDKEVLSCTFINDQLQNHAFLYKNGEMTHILNYSNNNLEGDQLSLESGYKIDTLAGKLIKDKRTTEKGNADILFAHEMILALVKWY